MKAPFSFPLSLAYLSAVFPLAAAAQIIPDQSLGAEGSVVVPAVIKGLPSDQLEGGALRGGNLFHSFGAFSVPDGRGAYFANPPGVANIFSRVTGGNISQILGTLGVLGNANLYFLNPNGIVFGPNARLDVRGSFLATTADSFIFENGFEFSAVNPAGPPLLTVNIPIGLNFRQDSPAQISNRGRLSAGQDLTLAGNNLDLQGQVVSGRNLTLAAEDRVQIRDSVDSPFIAAAGGELRVQGKQAVDIFALNHPESGFFSWGNLTLSSANPVGGDARFTSAGSFRIEGLNGALGELTSPNDPVIRAGGDVLIGSYEGASLHIIAGGKVEITDYVLITGADGEYGLQEAFSLADGTAVNIDGKTQPTLDIRAGVSPEALGEPFFDGSGADVFGEPLDFPENPTSADISVGSILFRDGEFNPIVGQVLLTNQYFPNANLTGDIQVQSTLGELGFGAIEAGGGPITLVSKGNINASGSVNSVSFGRGGDIVLKALGDIALISAEINVLGAEGGSAELTGRNITLAESQILGGVAPGLGASDGQSGDVVLRATESLSLDNSLIVNDINEGGLGNSGAVWLEADSVAINGVSAVSTDIYGQGDSGGVRVQATNLALTNGGVLSANVFGAGEAGNIDIDVADTVLISGQRASGFTSRIFSTVQPEAEGRSGAINLSAANLFIFEGGVISTVTLGQGPAGDIDLAVTGDLLVEGEDSLGFASRILSTVEPGAVGQGGEIRIQTNRMALVNGGYIDASALGEGDSGRARIRAEEGLVVAGEKSDGAVSFIASAVAPEARGNSGGIEIETGELRLLAGGELTASAFGVGDAGKISLKVDGALILEGEGSRTIGSRALSRVNGEGDSGGIEIEAGEVVIQGGAGLDASVLGTGNAGAIRIKTAGDIVLAGEDSQAFASYITSTTQPGARGNSGGIEITARNLELRDGAEIAASTLGQGDAGKISLQIEETLFLTGEDSEGFGSGIFNSVERNAQGNGAGIEIRTQNLLIENGAYIDSSAYGEGNAGLIEIRATGDVALRGERLNNGFVSNIATTVQAEGEGDSAGILLEARNLTLEAGAALSAATLGTGDAGPITVTVGETLTITGEDRQGRASRILSSVEPGALGNSGGILVSAPQIRLTAGGYIDASTVGTGDAGLARIQAQDLQIDGESRDTQPSGIISAVVQGATGNSGGVEITTERLSLTRGGAISASAQGNGNAGPIQIQAGEFIFIDGETSSGAPSRIISQVNPGVTGDSGAIRMTTPALTLTAGGEISASTAGQGDAGRIEIDGAEIVIEGNRINGQASRILSVITETAQGNSGGIQIRGENLRLRNSGEIDASTFGEGDSGSIDLFFTGVLSLGELNQPGSSSLISSSVEETGRGNSGGITISAGRLVLAEQSVISTGVFGEGNAGALNIEATEFIDLNFSGVLSVAGPEARGQAGTLTATAPRLTLAEGGFFSASTLGNGPAGDMTLGITGDLRLISQTPDRVSGILSITTTAQPAGDITLTTGRLLQEGYTIISSETESSGAAGQIRLTATDSVRIDGPGTISAALTTRTRGDGAAGNLEINTPRFTVTNGAQVVAGTTGNGPAGILRITAPDISLEGEGSGLFTQTEGSGASNDLILQTERLSVTDGALISASTASAGQGGSLTINSAERIELRGEGSSLQARTQGAGNAGNITITTPFFTVADGAEASVETTGAGSPGDIFIETNRLDIGANAELSATVTPASTNTQGGGSITLQTSELNISGQLGIFAETQGAAPAGNLRINPNDNNPDLNIRFTDDGFISARTAAGGQGGNIDISAPDLIDIRGQGRITAETSGAGNAGSIEFTSQRLNLADGVEVSATTTGTGNAGNISVNTPVNLTIGANSRLTAETQSAGRAGDITVTAETISLGTNSELSARATQTSTNQEGGGSINLNASQLNISGQLGIFAETQGQAPAGNLTIRPELTPDLNIRFTDNGFISALTTASGQGGNIDISAPDLIDIRGQGRITTETSGAGNAGVINLNSQRLNLQDGIAVSASTSNSGQGGSLTITAPESIRLQGAQLSTQATSAGEAGDINLTTRQLELTENGLISASSDRSRGGNVNLQNLETLTVNQGEISASTVDGSAGSLTVNSNQLAVNRVSLNQGSLAVKATGAGNSGNLSVNARTVELNNDAEISASTNSGAGESVTLTNVDTLTLNNGSQITATTQTGRAGSITVNSGQNPVNALQINQNSAISAQATGERGEAGSVELNTRNLTLEQGTVSASNQSGTVGGDVNLENLEILTVNQGEISASTVDGSAGSLTVNSNQLAVNRVALDNGSLAVKATGAGNSGNLS
ncbi:MAG: filamentous hemagglutinin N-terminal domain-containing protein, partial [Cyanobacteria bacterium RI_101]|nr:filamentous hemagglutinin N-terminal domain-containing protein [Cyanobacteria bacterium RI_101]